VRLLHLFGLSALSALQAGCYTLQPAQGIVPEIGSKVAFDVNDVGRVALGGQMGPEIAQIEGRLVSRDNGEFVLAVSEIHLLRGGDQVWNGEPVHLKSEYLGTAYERQFSKGRTIALAAVGIGGFAYIVTRSLVGSGQDAQAPAGTTLATSRMPARR
jgi:hypothetical protein